MTISNYGIRGSLTSFILNYKMADNMLETVTDHLYLGVIILNNISSSIHVDNISKKATVSINFITRNLKSASEKAKHKLMYH